MPDGSLGKSVVALGLAPYDFDDVWIRTKAFEIANRYYEWRQRKIGSALNCEIDAFARRSLERSMDRFPQPIVEQILAHSVFIKIITA